MDIDITFITDEAEAVLALIGQESGDWQRLFSSEGYTRLKKREISMRNSFEDAEFKQFVLSEDLRSRAGDLAQTLQAWKTADLNKAGQLAMAYLPKGTQIKVKVYLVIKPRPNSFVFEPETDPAIFLYLNPQVSPIKLTNTLAHELHHIGCVDIDRVMKSSTWYQVLPPPAQAVVEWSTAFGEGLAMLAAAGGPQIHPHAVSLPEERERWDQDMVNFNEDLRKVEAFFQDILSGRISGDEIGQAGFAFFGYQGAWYTVGWKMMAMIEDAFGRQELIASYQDPRKLFLNYNRAAQVHNQTAEKPLALWSEAFLISIT